MFDENEEAICERIALVSASAPGIKFIRHRDLRCGAEEREALRIYELGGYECLFTQASYSVWAKGVVVAENMVRANLNAVSAMAFVKKMAFELGRKHAKRDMRRALCNLIGAEPVDKPRGENE